ncbi:MAG: MFS transporter [Ktedonobacteraceae bacterium]|nr:MFS transporter [Ktedonobacteraceae bacterium]
MQETTSPSPTLRLPVGLAFFCFVLIGTNDGVNGVLLPSLNAFYAVGYAVLGLLFFVSSFGYFLSAISSGFLTQRLGLRGILLLGATAFLIGILPFGLKVPFVLLFPARLVFGLSVGLLETGLNIYITTRPRSTLILNYLHAFYGVGALIGPATATIILALQWGWNSVYLLLGGVDLLLLIGFGIFARPIQSARLEEKASTTENVLSVTLKLPVVWLITFFLLVYVGIEVSLGNWAYSFLLGSRHIAPFLAGWIVTGYWSGLTVGRFLLQNIAERLGLGTKGLIYLCICLVGVSLALIWLIPLEFIAIIALFLIGFGLGPIYPLTIDITPKLVPAHLGASAIGVLVSVSIIGLAVFPWLAGVLAQFVGIWTLLPYSLILTLVMLVLWRVLVVAASDSSKL